MDELDTEPIPLHLHPDHMRLVEAPQGCVCRFVGIISSGRRHGRHGPRRGMGRGRSHRRGDGHGFSGHDREMLRRLMDLGLTRGSVFKIVQGARHGPVLLEIRGTRIALGHGIASRLLVEEASCEI